MDWKKQIEFTQDAIQSRIDDIKLKAEKIVMDRLIPANALIKEIKTAMGKGIDLITSTQLQEWAVAIPIIIEEMIPHKEAFALTKDLWDIENRQLAAKNLLELDMKKTEIDNLNRIAGTDNLKNKAIASYMQSMLSGTHEALWVLGNSIRKIIDVRIAGGIYV